MFTAAQCWPVLKIERYQFERWFGSFVLVGQTWNSFPFHFFIIYHSRIAGIVDWQPKAIFSAWERMSCMTAPLSLRTLLQIYNNQTKLWRWHLNTFARTTVFTCQRNCWKKNTFRNWALLHLFRTISDWNLCDTGTMLIDCYGSSCTCRCLRWWARVDVKHQCPSSDAGRQRIICHFFPRCNCFHVNISDVICVGWAIQSRREGDR